MSVRKLAKLSVLPRYFRWTFIDKAFFKLKEHLEEENYVYDSDNCGDSTSYYVLVEDGEAKFYLFKHQWWWEKFGQEDSFLENEFELCSVSKDEIEDKYAAANLAFVV